MSTLPANFPYTEEEITEACNLLRAISSGTPVYRGKLVSDAQRRQATRILSAVHAVERNAH